MNSNENNSSRFEKMTKSKLKKEIVKMIKHSNWDRLTFYCELISRMEKDN